METVAFAAGFQQEDVFMESFQMVLRVWCLLITSDIWSNQLKDVANEVAAVLAHHAHSTLDSGSIEHTASRILKSVIHITALVTFDSKTQHMLPACVKFIALVVKSLLHESDVDVNTQLYLTELAFFVVKVAEKILDRLINVLLSV